MGGWGSFGYNQAKSDSTATSGLRGSAYDADSAQEAWRGGHRLNEVSQRGGIDAQGRPTYMGFTGEQMLPGGRFGLGSNADLAMETLGSQLFGRSSSNLAASGMVSPQNQSAVVGSAITQALPQVLPAIQSWQQAQFMAPMNLGQYATEQAKTAADYWSRVRGAQSDSSSRAFGFNVAGGGGVSGGGGGVTG